MRLRGRQLDGINAALKSGTAEDFNAALQKTCAQAEGIGQFVAAPGSTTPTQRERDLRSIVRTIMETPRNPARWEEWARVQLEKAEAGMVW